MTSESLPETAALKGSMSLCEAILDWLLAPIGEAKLPAGTVGTSACKGLYCIENPC